GKSQLAEAMLFTAGNTTPLGRREDGSAGMDSEPEEPQRGGTIASSFHHLNSKRTEVILRHTPGCSAFLPETFNALKAVDGVVMLVSPGGDMKVESEKIWDAVNEAHLPHMAFVSRLDKERTSFESAINDLEKHLEAKPIALSLPIGEE